MRALSWLLGLRRACGYRGAGGVLLVGDTIGDDVMLNETAYTATMIDAGAKALREKMQAGKKLSEWRMLPNSTKKKWRDYAALVLEAAEAVRVQIP